MKELYDLVDKGLMIFIGILGVLLLFAALLLIVKYMTVICEHINERRKMHEELKTLEAEKIAKKIFGEDDY